MPGVHGSPRCFGSDLGTEDPGRVLPAGPACVVRAQTHSSANTSFKQVMARSWAQGLPGASPSNAPRGSVPWTRSQGRRLSLMSWNPQS